MSGAMAFFGASAAANGSIGEVAISNANPSDTAISPSVATATYSLTNAGSVTSTGEAGGFWLDPQVGMEDFECRATVTSGSLTSGTTGSWLALSTTRSWTVQQSVVGTKLATMTIEIRRIGETTVLGSATVSFSAEVIQL